MAQKQSLILASGVVGLALSTVSGPWKLSPAAPVISGRATLTATHVNSIYSTSSPSDPLVYGIDAAGLVGLWFKPPVIDKKYLMDCKVGTASKYRVEVYPGGATQTFESTNHLVVMYEAESGDEASIRMSAQPPNAWNFYSCEVTQLD